MMSTNDDKDKTDISWTAFIDLKSQHANVNIGKVSF